MKGLFSKLEIKDCSSLSKQDKKKLGLIQKEDYKNYNVNSKLKLIGNSAGMLYFVYFDKLYPTIRNFDPKNYNKEIYKKVVLDDGACGPLSRGADVMCSGIIKYKEISDDYKKDDIIVIEIINIGVFAIGTALISLEETIRKAYGPAIEILHVKGDHLFTGSF